KREAGEDQHDPEPRERQPGPGPETHELSAGAVVLARHQQAGHAEETGPDLEVPAVEFAAAANRAAERSEDHIGGLQDSLGSHSTLPPDRPRPRPSSRPSGAVAHAPVNALSQPP